MKNNLYVARTALIVALGGFLMALMLQSSLELLALLRSNLLLPIWNLGGQSAR